MKKKISMIIIILLSAKMILKAQVGINTNNPNSSAILEVSSNLKRGGILLPRIKLTNATDMVTIPNPAPGLMIYNLQNAGTATNSVEADHMYIWNGTRWNDIADIQILKKLLLPQIFFCQETSVQNLSSSDRSTLNSGGDILITFQNVILNNGNNVTMNNSIFTINTTGKYEISGYVNYNPDISSENNTNLVYKILKSSDNGVTWNQIAQTTLVWGKMTGGFSRTLIIPPSVLELNGNDRIKAVISKTYGANHGEAYISVPGGLNHSKNLRILKLD